MPTIQQFVAAVRRPHRSQGGGSQRRHRCSSLGDVPPPAVGLLPLEQPLPGCREAPVLMSARPVVGVLESLKYF